MTHQAPYREEAEARRPSAPLAFVLAMIDTHAARYSENASAEENRE